MSSFYSNPGMCFFPSVCVFLSFPLLPKPSSPPPLPKTIHSLPLPPNHARAEKLRTFFHVPESLGRCATLAEKEPSGAAGTPPKRGTLLVSPPPHPHNDALAVNVIIIRIQNSATKVDVFSILYLNIIKNIFCYEINNATN
jgi:hypothetical protein